MRENMDQNNSEYEHFSRSVSKSFSKSFVYLFGTKNYWIFSKTMNYKNI